MPVLFAGVNAPSAACSVYGVTLARLMSHPAKVTTPAVAAFGPLFGVQPRDAPAGVVIVSVMPLMFPVIVFPPASWMATEGCWAKSTPPVAIVLGWVTKPRRDATPTETVIVVLVTPRPPLAVACNVYGVAPARLMSQPAKVATPATAATGPLLVQPRAAPAGVEMARVTPRTSVVTVLPPASRTATRGCRAKSTPPVAVVLGCVANASCAPAPTETVMPALSAAASAPSTACNV